MALVNQNNQLVNVSAASFNVQYNAQNNEYEGKDSKKFASIRKHLKEVQFLFQDEECHLR
jgi:hypothetical protein